MDHKDVVGDAEGLGSSESGWTEYISSPIQDHYGELAEGFGEVEEDDDDQEDGDSVASDASTGQLLHQSQHSSRSAVVGEEREGSDDTRDGQTVKEQRAGFKALKGRGGLGDDGKAPGGVSATASKEVAAAAAAATPSDNNLEVTKDLKC